MHWGPGEGIPLAAEARPLCDALNRAGFTRDLGRSPVRCPWMFLVADGGDALQSLEVQKTTLCDLVDSGRLLVLGHGFAGSSTVYLMPDGRAVKEYLPFVNKVEPTVRGLREYEVLHQVRELPGVPHQVELVIEGDRVFLLREAGEEPAFWNDRHLAELQVAMAGLVRRRITLGDRAQAMVRADGSAFFSDFDHARSSLDWKEADRWHDADSNYRCFLRDQGLAERPLLGMLEYFDREYSAQIAKGGAVAEMYARLRERQRNQLERARACYSGRGTEIVSEFAGG